MCELIDKYENRGMQKGIRKGMRRGMQKGICKGIRQGIQQGAEKTILADIKKLMKNLKLTADQAMAILEIPEEQQQRYRHLIGN